ncbi:MAG: hypothetical protein C5B58_12640 [Acidobacteria bacterium]|nr:MAG: hypothetical protein C5B58_12640 [Acidobacteriota bacterium]
MIDSKISRPSLGIVLRGVGRIVTIGALCCAIGLHWIVLQSFAWTSMLIDYSKRAPLCQAIVETFDGAHPCSLCHVVATGKASEKKSDIQSPAQKIDIICVARVIRLISPLARFQYGSCDFSVSEIEQSPPVPPPRSFLS